MEDGLVAGRAWALVGLLEDIHRLYDDQIPRPSVIYYGDKPYIPLVTGPTLEGGLVIPPCGKLDNQTSDPTPVLRQCNRGLEQPPQRHLLEDSARFAAGKDPSAIGRVLQMMNSRKENDIR